MNATTTPRLHADPDATLVGGLYDSDRDSLDNKIVQVRLSDGFLHWIDETPDLRFQDGYVFRLTPLAALRAGVVCATCADEGETHCTCNVTLDR